MWEKPRFRCPLSCLVEHYQHLINFLAYNMQFKQRQSGADRYLASPSSPTTSTTHTILTVLVFPCLREAAGHHRLPYDNWRRSCPHSPCASRLVLPSHPLHPWHVTPPKKILLGIESIDICLVHGRRISWPIFLVQVCLCWKRHCRRYEIKVYVKQRAVI